MLKRDKMLSITELSARLGVKSRRIMDILVHGKTGWTKKKIRARGTQIRVAKVTGKRKKERVDYAKDKHPCAGNCGLLIAKKGHYCKFCVLDANGIHDLNDIRFKEHDEAVLGILRCEPTRCFESVKIAR